MAKAKKKGSPVTKKASERGWFDLRQGARNVKNSKRTGTSTANMTGKLSTRGGSRSVAAEAKRLAAEAPNASETSDGPARPPKPGSAAKAARNAGTRSAASGRTSSRGGAQSRGGAPARGQRPEGRLGSVRKTPEGPEIVTGRNPVLEALRASVPATTLYYLNDGDDRVREAIQIAADKGIAMLEMGKVEMDRLTDRSVHQGIALAIKPYRYAHPEDLLRGTAPLIVALDGVTDARNLGAIVRSAAAFGASGVLLPERRSASVNAGAWKASAGTLATMPVAQCTNLVRQLKAYQDAGCFVAGLDAHGGTSVADIEFADRPFVLVVGSEGKGLGRLVGDACDLLVHIPMAGHAESLNAGVAAGVALYEIARLRHN